MSFLDENENELPTEDEIKDAVAAATNIMVFADNTEKNLRDKLERKGFSEASVDVAVEKLKAAGVVNDGRFMYSVVSYLADKKLYGKGRIKAELQKKGFERQLIAEQFEDCIGDIDFKKNCLMLIKKKRLDKKLTEGKSADAVTAALARYGYGYSEIKYAYTRLLEEYQEE